VSLRPATIEVPRPYNVTAVLRPLPADDLHPFGTYRVEVDGVVIGYVYRQQFTRERRTPGRRYVNRRWQSPGWTFTVREGEFGRWEVSNRAEGVRRLLDARST
jgi:hypothetical protein